jgi:MFS family permease
MYAIFAYPVGILADKVGLKKIFLFGLAVFAAVYIGFALNNDLLVFFLLFVLYGLYAAATDGISKAWISNIVDKKEIATAIGTYTGFQSICAFIASSFCGFLWFKFGAKDTFLITAGITLLVIIYLSFNKVNKKTEKQMS